MPAVILAPVLALSSIGAAYAAWDSTRVVMPDLVGQPLSDGVHMLEGSTLHVPDMPPTDSVLGPDCYRISHQSIAAGERVVADEALVALQIEPTRHAVPDVTGMTFAEATRTLLRSCLVANQARLWCVPDGFSGGEAALGIADLEQATGFTFDSVFNRLRNDSLPADDSWEVCDQLTAPPTILDAGSSVGLVAVAPLTIVPSPATPVLASVLDSLKTTADGCTLTPQLATTFPENPQAISGARQPSTQEMAGWSVASLTPEPGSPLLCEENVRVELVWPKTSMPNLVGLFHSSGASQAQTATTSALESAGLVAECSGRGTVTSQSPAPGEAVPVGTAVTCLAELVMPNILGMDPMSAQATLSAAGVTATSSGSGTVVTQSPAAGTLLTGSQYVSFYAETPRPQPVVGGGGSAYYKNCDAARAAGAAPIYRGEAGYRPALDRDDDGVACE